MNRRYFLQTAFAGFGMARLATAGMASDHFDEWYRAKTSIGYFVSHYFPIPDRLLSRQWLKIISEGDIGNRYLLKLHPGDRIAGLLAAAAAHRLVFFSGVHVGLMGQAGVSRQVVRQVFNGLKALPPWMCARATPWADGLELSNGNRLTVFSDPGRSRFSDLLISGVDHVSEPKIRSSVLAASGGCVVMTTSRQSYRPLVDCMELKPGMFDAIYSALDGR